MRKTWVLILLPEQLATLNPHSCSSEILSIFSYTFQSPCLCSYWSLHLKCKVTSNCENLLFLQHLKCHFLLKFYGASPLLSHTAIRNMAFKKFPYGILANSILKGIQRLGRLILQMCGYIRKFTSTDFTYSTYYMLMFSIQHNAISTKYSNTPNIITREITKVIR